MANQYILSPGGGQGGSSKGSLFAIGRVKSIVLGEFRYDGIRDPDYASPKDLGKISYELLYASKGFPSGKGNSMPAYPIFTAIRQYPLISEIVLIMPGPDSDMNDNVEIQGMYYFPPYSLWNSVNHNAFPNLFEYADYVNTQFETIQTENKTLNTDAIGKLPLGYMFSEKTDVRNLRPFEGDTIIESRFGQSIRFGSTNITKNMNTWSSQGELGKPITIIRNGQGPQSSPDYFEPTVENINTDNSTIWMTSGQTINIEDISLFPLKSFGEKQKVATSNVQNVNRIATSTEVTSAINQDRSNLAGNN
jgi:hypothetical protein